MRSVDRCASAGKRFYDLDLRTLDLVTFKPVTVKMSSVFARTSAAALRKKCNWLGHNIEKK